MRHAEVAQTPSEAGEDVGYAHPVEGTTRQHIVIILGKNRTGVNHIVSGLDGDKGDDRAEHQRAKHQQTLEEVCPAHRVEASQKCVKHDNGSRNDHRYFGIDVKYCLEEISAGDNARRGIDAVDYDKNQCRDNLQGLVLSHKAVGEKLGNGDGVVGSDGISAQFRRNEYPRRNRAAEQTDSNPHLTHACQIDGSRQTHEHPGAHVGGSCAESGHKAVHVSSAQEILLFALALFRLDKEENADSYHKYKIDSDSA